MARSGLYKSDIERARASLVAQGKHPSVDALRVALGNTGSKTTIHRYLKELEAEDEGKVIAISEALQDLVMRLAAQLQHEADDTIARAKETFEGQLQIHRTREDAHQSEAVTLGAQARQTEAALFDERTAHASTHDSLAAATLTVGQWEERNAGLIARLAEQEHHVRNLEEQHGHARDALGHYRTSVREQRDQELRRHEHQIQGLQVELRQAQDALTGKNQDLVGLNRDNVGLLDLNRRLTLDLEQAQQRLAQCDQQLDTLRGIESEHAALHGRWIQDTQVSVARDAERSQLQRDLADERIRRGEAEVELLQAVTRLATLQPLLDRLQFSGSEDSIKTTQPAI